MASPTPRMNNLYGASDCHADDLRLAIAASMDDSHQGAQKAYAGLSDSNPARATYSAARNAETEEDEARAKTRARLDDGPASSKCNRGSRGEGEDGRHFLTSLPLRRNIDDCIKQLQYSPNPKVPRPESKGADTAIFIDLPPSSSNYNSFYEQGLRNHYSEEFFICSQKLKALNSEIFDGLLGPNETFRVKRRRQEQVKKIEKNRPSIKFFIDLTPKLEGDAAVMMTANLSLPLGVRLWGLSARRWAISSNLVGGTDDGTLTEVNPGSSPGKMTFSSQTSDERPSTNGKQEKSTLDDTYQLPSEYSPIRHHASIERLLLAIEGTDPALNSAPKMYSAAVLSESYCILNNPLTDYVVRWLRAPPNSCFLEVLPEVALKMAECVRAGDMARDSFAVLVGEGVLDMVVQRQGQLLEGFTTHHRRKEDLDETWQNRIEHARLSFLDRIQTRFDSLVSENMEWVEALPEFEKLRKATAAKADSNASHESELLQRALKDFVKSTIIHNLCANPTLFDNREISGSAGTDKLFPTTSLQSTWESLTPQQRIFTRSFWELIKTASFFHLGKNIHVSNLGSRSRSYNLGDSNVTPFHYANTHFRAAGITHDMSTRELYDARDKAYNAFNPNEPEFWSGPSQPLSSQLNDMLSERSMVDAWADRARQLYSAQFDVKASGKNDRDAGQSHLAAYPPSGSQRRSESSEHGLPIRTTSMVDNVQGTDVMTRRDVKTFAMTPAVDARVSYQSAPTRSLQAHRMGASYDPPKYDTVWGDTRMEDQRQEDQAPFTKINKFGDDKDHGPEANEGDRHHSAFFDVKAFLLQVQFYLERVAESMLAFPDCSIRDEQELYVTNVLLCLDEAETKYLPLWAGGFDDGSNGVFSSDIPLADHGFTTAGPHIHGVGASSSGSRASSEFEAVDGQSTIGSSAFVNDGYSEAMERRRVYAFDDTHSADGTDSVTWSDVGDHLDKADYSTCSELRDDTVDGTDSDLEVITPQGRMGNPDLQTANEALGEITAGSAKRDQVLREEGRGIELEDGTYDDIFDDSEEENDFDNDMPDAEALDQDFQEDDDDDDDYDEDKDRETENLYAESMSFRGFDSSSTCGNTRDDEPMEDAGEHSGHSRQGARVTGPAHNPTIVYKELQEEQDRKRP